MTDPANTSLLKRIALWTAEAVYANAVQLAIGAALSLAVCLSLIPVKVDVPGPTVEVPIVVVAATEPATVGEHGGMGWAPPSPEQIAANLDPAQTLQFDTTPAGKALLGDSDLFLYDAVRKVNHKAAPWYPNVDQKSVGCCVGCGFKHAIDVCQATIILAGKQAEWKPVSVEAIYAMSRVDIGGNRLRGDGSVGAWAKEAVVTEGIAAMEKYGDVDLTEFSPTRAREWGARGVPQAVKDSAKAHLVKSTGLVKSWADVKRAIQQGYPIAVCSNVGFDNRDGTVGVRDQDGFIAPRGTWNHCMAIIGIRSTGKEGGFILNSWGDKAHRGPTWPADAPVAGFWADAATIDRMVRQADSFALSDVAGFPSRKIPLDWFIQRPEPKRLGFDLNRELALAW